MNKKIVPFHVPSISEDEIRSVVEVLRSGWLTAGPAVKQFEDDFAQFIGAQHAVAANSATSALHLALDALGVQEGDEVIVPTWTFTATAAVVAHCRATPVLVDCDEDTLNLDAALVEDVVTPRTKAIIPVHFGGLPCNMDILMDISKRHNIRIVEDAAHALPASYNGKRIGTVGDITCFSFYATKTMTTGEGGMATTNNPEWAKRMRVMSLHGITEDAWCRYSERGSWFYEVMYPGFKYNMNDIAAAIGLAQLKKVECMRESRSDIVQRYTEAFSKMPEVSVPDSDPQGAVHAWHLYVLRLNLDQLTISRDQFIQELKQRGVSASVHFIPLHKHPYYRDTFGCDPADFPHAEYAFQRSISLPLYPGMTDEDVCHVIDAVQMTLKTFRR